MTWKITVAKVTPASKVPPAAVGLDVAVMPTNLTMENKEFKRLAPELPNNFVGKWTGGGGGGEILILGEGTRKK